jgi:PleD family two-component response regulator
MRFPERRPVVLLLEDDNAGMSAIQKAVEKVGEVEMVVAQTAREALEILGKTSPNIAIINVDITTPDNTPLIEKIRNIPRFQFLPIIALSNARKNDEENNEARERFMELGANEYLIKPVPEHELTAQINFYLR